MENVQITDELQVEKRPPSSRHYIYIAAPFFNAHEVKKVAQIETMLEEYGYRFFSPRLQHVNKKPDLTSHATRAEIMITNLKALSEATLVIAWIDRMQLCGDEVMMVHLPKTIKGAEGIEEIVRGVVKRRNLCTPDQGTIWEMGYAYARMVPVVALTLREPESLNLMLTMSVNAVAFGMEKLLEFLGENTPEVSNWRFDMLSAWTGKHI